MGKTIRDEEASVLSKVLRVIAIKERTGEVGVVHGMDRFVSTHVCLKKADVAALDSVARSLGAGKVRRVTK